MGVHERVATVSLQHQRLPLCLRNNVNSGGAQEGSEDGATLLIFPCLCDDNGSNGSSEDGTSALSVIPCSCNNEGGISVDNGTLALLIVPCSCEQEGSMMRGDATASQKVARGGGMRRADVMQRWRDERQCNNQLAH